MFARIYFASAAFTISVIALSGCSSIISGTSQQLSINSNPSGAVCVLERQSLSIGQVTTPGGLNVTRTKHNINIKCTKDGYEPATAFLKSGIAGATFGNIILGGGIGWAVDSAAGADNHYEEVTTVTLVPINAASRKAASSIEDKTATNPSSDSASRLKLLDNLRNEGTITPAEYQTRRKAIIDGL